MDAHKTVKVKRLTLPLAGICIDDENGQYAGQYVRKTAALVAGLIAAGVAYTV